MAKYVVVYTNIVVCFVSGGGGVGWGVEVLNR